MDNDINKKPPHSAPHSSRKKQGSKIPEYIFNIIIHFVLIYIIFQLSSWLSFLTPAFGAIVWLLFVSYLINIVVNGVYLIYDPAWFKALTQLFINSFNLIIFYSLLVIFPFDLNSANQVLAHIIIYIIIFGISIAVIVELIKFVKQILKYCMEVKDEG